MLFSRQTIIFRLKLNYWQFVTVSLGFIKSKIFPKSGNYLESAEKPRSDETKCFGKKGVST